MEDFISVEQLEKLRSKAQKREKAVYILSAFLFLVYLYLLYIVMRQSEEMSAIFIAKLFIMAAVLAIATFGLLWCVIVKSAYNKFNETFKSKYVLQTINKIKGFGNLKYYQKNGFSWDDVRNAAVVNCGDKKYYESEDLLFGEYESVSFKISDVTTKKIVRRNKKNRIEEIFSGQIICIYQFDEMKVSSGHLQVFEKEFLSNMAGWKAKHEIHTENESFNSRFSVYASDEHNAYYILTPHRIEKIMSFADMVNGQVSLVFYDDKLFVAVRRESMFDAVTNEPVLSQTGKIEEDADFIKIAKEILVAQ